MFAVFGDGTLLSIAFAGAQGFACERFGRAR
jgi:hypothetical protein